jgi:hypothetical protein
VAPFLSQGKEVAMGTTHGGHQRVVLAGLALALFASPLHGQEQRVFQLSLVTPLQIFPEEDRIGGVRVNLIYGRNVSVAGLDIGIANHTTTGTTKGVQFGIVGIADNAFMGWQANWVNYTKGKFEGFQQGLVNVAGEAVGFQYALANITDEMTGLQLSLVNYTKRMRGIQVGLVNIIKEGGFLPVFPIVNWSFE